MRLFVAIELSEDIKDALSSVIISLKRQGADANFTRRDNMHLTLAFIGETPRLADAKACIDTVDADAFEFSISDSGCFGDLMWVGGCRRPALDALAQKVRRSLLSAGFAIDEKPFRSHITVARRLVCEVKPTVSVPPAKMRVSEITLMRSDRVNGKLVYTPVHRKRLRG